MSLLTPKQTVQKLQSVLHAKAKSDANFRFYSLWDKVFRRDTLKAAYQQCRSNGGASGSDGETFESIELLGVDSWLANLQQELKSGAYQPQSLLRVWIPKPNGGQRPLGIPTIKDRVVQTAVVLVISPIFEADLLPSQYGYRPGLDAKLAVRRVYFHLTQHHRSEVVDADLSDYFNMIPHGPLMKTVSRRIADGSLLKIIKKWLQAPVTEKISVREQRTTEAKDGNRGTPQGGVISPLLANLYFRRFLLAWEKFGYDKRWNTGIVNYADDFVICTKPGNGPTVLLAMKDIMQKLGLTVNEQKTQLVNISSSSFDFLGYSFGRSFGKAGRSYVGTWPSKKSVQKVIGKIHDETSRRWLASETETRVIVINRILRGWSNYFNQGPVIPSYQVVEKYCLRRIRRFLVKKHKQRGHGIRKYSDEYLFNRLGLYKLPMTMAEVARAKA